MQTLPLTLASIAAVAVLSLPASAARPVPPEAEQVSVNAVSEAASPASEENPAVALTVPAQAQSGESAAPRSSTGPLILRSESDMPEPVRQMRRQLMEAAKSGDLDQLRALMNAQPELPAVAIGDPGDPIGYLKALSSDTEGREMLAILLEVLEAGFVRVEPGTADELYVWPYFAQVPLEALTPPQLVELFTLLTAADYEDMRSYGSYTFFRVGIAPDGRWLFFLAGS